MDNEFVIFVKSEKYERNDKLALKYFCSTKTIVRYLDKAKMLLNQEFNQFVNGIMDVSCFGRKWGVMVFKDSFLGNFSTAAAFLFAFFAEEKK